MASASAVPVSDLTAQLECGHATPALRRAVHNLVDALLVEQAAMRARFPERFAASDTPAHLATSIR